MFFFNIVHAQNNNHSNDRLTDQTKLTTSKPDQAADRHFWWKPPYFLRQAHNIDSQDKEKKTKETADETAKKELNTLTKTPTDQAITITQAEVTSKDQNALNKFLKQPGSLTVNTDATIEFDTTNNKATITATPNSTKAQGSVVFTNETAKKELNTLTKPTTETITVT
ncbi:hypothetical protein [Candidatus Phytoplasma solani]|uniref:hypothetical protein n=1 Tax=Candidatus Phytoplasma solani TaxID=69896 RepID=UPI00358E13F9